MTSAELLAKFRLNTEIISSYEMNGLLDEEIFDLLNTAQNEIIIALCASRNFESLYPLAATSAINLTAEGVAPVSEGKVYKGNLPTDFYHMITTQVAVTRAAIPSTGFIPSYENATKTIVIADEVPVDVSRRFLQTLGNKYSVFLNPIFWVDSNSNGDYYAGIKVVVDYLTTLSTVDGSPSGYNALVQYVKKPTTIDASNTSDLPEKMHELVVAKAIENRSKNLVNNVNKQ